MNMHRQFQRFDAADQGARVQYLCWTRMQAEAGQGLDRILARKENERQAGGGLFFWGVGNAPATAIRALARCSIDVRVIFSIMKGRPKTIDTDPEAVVFWSHYIDCEGIERPLPEHVLVTSRRDSGKGPKQAHFALMCFSEEPLKLTKGIGFDHQAYRNVGGAGAPVGASQVTALLQPARAPQAATYEANMEAKLAGSYWVKLTRPAALPPQASSALLEPGDALGWLNVVKEIRAMAPIESNVQWDLLRA